MLTFFAVALSLDAFSHLAFLRFTFHLHLHCSNYKIIKNIQAVSNNQIADIFHFNGKTHYSKLVIGVMVDREL